MPTNQLKPVKVRKWGSANWLPHRGRSNLRLATVSAGHHIGLTGDSIVGARLIPESTQIRIGSIARNWRDMVVGVHRPLVAGRRG